jgi:AcrR family transcriptional regulator
VAQLVKSDLREAIIAVGLQLGTQLGEEGLTMRAIAGRLGVSATALYQCFESKASILRAIRFFGLEQLDEHIAPAFGVPDPIERLSEMCVRYIEFARRNPWLYSVLTDEEELDWSRLGEQEREVLLMPQRRIAQCFADAIERGRFRADLDPGTAPLALLAAVHGAATLMIKRRISETHPVFPIRNEQLFLSDFIAGVLRGFIRDA